MEHIDLHTARRRFADFSDRVRKIPDFTSWIQPWKGLIFLTASVGLGFIAYEKMTQSAMVRWAEDNSPPVLTLDLSLRAWGLRPCIDAGQKHRLERSLPAVTAEKSAIWIADPAVAMVWFDPGADLQPKFYARTGLDAAMIRTLAWKP